VVVFSVNYQEEIAQIHLSRVVSTRVKYLAWLHEGLSRTSSDYLLTGCAMLCRARYCYGKSFICPSLRIVVTQVGILRK